MFTKEWYSEQYSWNDFVKNMKPESGKFFTRTNETLSQYSEMDKTDKDKLKNTGAFFCGELNAPERRKTNFESRSMITLDADFADESFFKKVYQILPNFNYILYESRSSRPGKLKYRLIIPMDRDMDRIEHEAISRVIANYIGIEYFDKASFEDVRAMYTPSASKDQDINFYENKGRAGFLPKENVLNTLNNYKNPEEWPYRADEEKPSIARVNLLKKQDPRFIKGIVGEFCCIFDISDAIHFFLSDIYEEDFDGRYTYLDGSSAGGLIVLTNDNGDKILAYSHHDTDPINTGHAYNAYDLVRTHLFGDLDDDYEGKFNGAPSVKAMNDFVREDEVFRKYRGITHKLREQALIEARNNK